MINVLVSSSVSQRAEETKFTSRSQCVISFVSSPVKNRIDPAADAMLGDKSWLVKISI